MYVCGVTVYDYSHIGHARVYVAFDILYRFLQHLGYDVTYIRNFTDIDDKIINRANEAGEDPLALSRRFIDEFYTDMDALHCLRPTMEPKATDHIHCMLASIQKIIDNGHAYVVDGDVYFDVESLPGYGKLSGRQQDDNRAGERVVMDERKRSPADFALWKSAKPGEPTWNSPWGPGRPGWHIECSAMIQEILGNVIDIHGGGRDLVFPHHENELAQARAAEPHACTCHQNHHAGGTGDAHDDGICRERDDDDELGDGEREFVRYWVHNGFVNVDAEKMSKSLGNFFTIREVLQRYHPLALRWFLVNTQYRQGINYTQRALEESSDRMYYLFQTLIDAKHVVDSSEVDDTRDVTTAAAGRGGNNMKIEAQGGTVGEGMLQEVLSFLADDLNTSGAVAAFSAPLKTLNDLIHTKKGRKQADRLQIIESYYHALHAALDLLGLWPTDLRSALDDMRALALHRAGLTEEHVIHAIQERAEARAAKDFDAADAVRTRLEAVGIAIMDTPEGTTWRPAPQHVD